MRMTQCTPVVSSAFRYMPETIVHDSYSPGIVQEWYGVLSFFDDVIHEPSRVVLEVSKAGLIETPTTNLLVRSPPLYLRHPPMASINADI